MEVVVSEKQAYQERESTWCWNVPPKCSKYKIKFKTVNKTQSLPKTRVVKSCCGNYNFLLLLRPLPVTLSSYFL